MSQFETPLDSLANGGNSSAVISGSGLGPLRIAIVGSGPRGMGVLERIAARLLNAPDKGPVEIFLIDSCTVGSGRVWRPDQPEWFLMNTVAGEVSGFSGPPDGGPSRPGAGPSLVQWWKTIDPSSARPDADAPRAIHGRYLRFILDAVDRWLPPGARLHQIEDLVEDLEPTSAGYRLTLAGRESLTVDKVVLTTGHTLPGLTGREQQLSEFAGERPHLRYIRSDSAADMPLDAIPASAKVGIIGLGLSFYDVIFALTAGRGGKFLEAGNGKMTYHPSGSEPLLLAGSRSGMPILARSRNQKPADFSYEPLLFTAERALARSGAKPVNFQRHAFPLLLAEMDLVFHATMVRESFGSDMESAFRLDVAKAAGDGIPDICGLAARLDIGEHQHFTFHGLTHPFSGRYFPDQRSFQNAVIKEMRADLARAKRGNYADPLKAAIDVIRDTRSVVRKLVDYGGLQARSHERDFLGWFSPATAFLAVGPPAHRVPCVLTLIERGLLRLVGPGTQFSADAVSERFVVESAQVRGSRTEVDVLVDARIPNPNVALDTSPLTGRLLDRGIWTEFVNSHGPGSFHTGGVSVTQAPFHPVGRDGTPDRGLYVLGIPTEHTRWGTRVVSGRPWGWNKFTKDADAIAKHALSRRSGGTGKVSGDVIRAGENVALSGSGA